MSDDFCYVTTRGRITGKPHRVEIWYARDGETIYLLSGGGTGSDWVKNLMADPHCEVVIGNDRRGAIARIVDPASSEDPLARKLVFDKYAPRYDGDLTSWRKTATPVALDLSPRN